MRKGASEIPRAARSSISAMISPGSTTTPAPTMERQFALRMPDGMRWSANVPWSVWTVWPALAPPLARMTTSADAANESVSLPFPSSPH
jgi:hypothetical protein